MNEPPLPTVRESADALGIRLARIGAAATTLRGLTADLRLLRQSNTAVWNGCPIRAGNRRAVRRAS